jgi:Flp pilus assembly pilin Flp
MGRMKRFFFAPDEHGQDLTEYALLLAFVCVISAAIFVVSGGSFVAIWNASNSTLQRAAAQIS